MKGSVIAGVVLVVLGVVGFAVGGISFTHEKKDIDLGPVQVSHDKKETIPISPILSTVSLIAGAGLIVVGLRSRS